MKAVRLVEPGSRVWQADVHDVGQRRYTTRCRPTGYPTTVAVQWIAVRVVWIVAYVTLIAVADQHRPVYSVALLVPLDVETAVDVAVRCAGWYGTGVAGELRPATERRVCGPQITEPPISAGCCIQ